MSEQIMGDLVPLASFARRYESGDIDLRAVSREELEQLQEVARLVAAARSLLGEEVPHQVSLTDPARPSRRGPVFLGAPLRLS